MYTLWSMCGPSLVNLGCMIMRNWPNHKNLIINAVIAAARKAIPISCLAWAKSLNSLYVTVKNIFKMWVSEWLLFNTNSAIFQLLVYHGENKLIFNEMMTRSILYLTNTLSWIFIVLAHWNNSPGVDMSLHSDILFWFWANQCLLLLLTAVCLAEKQQIPIF